MDKKVWKFIISPSLQNHLGEFEDLFIKSEYGDYLVGYSEHMKNDQLYEFLKILINFKLPFAIQWRNIGFIYRYYGDCHYYDQYNNGSSFVNFYRYYKTNVQFNEKEQELYNYYIVMGMV